LSLLLLLLMLLMLLRARCRRADPLPYPDLPTAWARPRRCEDDPVGSPPETRLSPMNGEVTLTSRVRDKVSQPRRQLTSFGCRCRLTLL